MPVHDYGHIRVCNLRQAWAKLLPPGGNAGQVLGKLTSATGDVDWISVPSEAELDALSNVVSNLASIHNVLSNRVSSISTNLSNLQSAINVVSNVLSQEASVRIARDNILSNAISAVSAAAGSVTCAELSAAASNLQSAINIVSAAAANAASIGNAASAIAANATSIANAASAAAADAISIGNAASVVAANAVSIGNAASAAASNALSVAQVASGIAANATSIANAASNAASAVEAHADAISNTLSDLISAHNVLSNRVSVNSGVGGGGSVTSAEVNAVSTQAASAINVISNLLSGVSARFHSGGASVKGIQSAINYLSQTIASVEHDIAKDVSLLHISVSEGFSSINANASNLLSSHNALSNWLSAVSVRTSGTSGVGSSKGVQNCVNWLSNRICNTRSIAAAASAEAANALSVGNAASVVAANALSVGNAASVVAANATSIANAASAAAANAASIANAASAQAASAINVISNYLSGLSGRDIDTYSVHGLQSIINGLSDRIGDAKTDALNALSIISTTNATVSNLLSAHNALCDRVSANSGVGGGGSVTSNELSTVSAQAASAIDVVSNAVSVLSAAVTPRTFYPTTLSVTVGTLAAGTVADLSGYGGGSVVISEIVSTPGLLATVQFSTVGVVPNMLVVHGAYEGGAGHIVNVDIWNHATSVWANLGHLPDNASAQTFYFNLGEATNYVSTSIARIRFDHLSLGIGTHELMLDYVAIARLLQGAGITDHGGLQGLDDDDHLQYALADGSRGFTVVSNAISNEISARQSASAALQASLNTISDALCNEISDRHSVSAVLQTSITTISNLLSSVSSRNSAGTSGKGLQTAINTLSNRISELSVTLNGVGNVSDQISILSQAVSVLSQQVSVLSAAVGTRYYVVAAEATCSAAAMTDISGLAGMTVSANGVYELQAVLGYSTSAGQAVGFGLSFPAATEAAGEIRGGFSIANVDATLSLLNHYHGWFNRSATGSVALSIATGAGAVNLPVIYQGMFYFAANGTMALMTKASGGTGRICISRGSYCKLARIGTI